MPFKDPRLQDKPKATDQFCNRVLLDERLDGTHLLNHIATNIISLGIVAANTSMGAPPKVKFTEPLAIDKETMAKITAKLNEVAGKEYSLAFDQCNPEQKAKVLKFTLEANGAFGLKYDRGMDQKPQTVMEFLNATVPVGNCADFSRMFVAVANEKKLTAQMVSVTFQAQDGPREEEQHLAVFNMADKTYYFDLSNQVMRVYTGFASTQDLVRDPAFQQDISEDFKRVVKDGKEYTMIEEPRIMTDEKAYQATYWADMGHYYMQRPVAKPEDKKADWSAAISSYEKAGYLGLDAYWLNSELGRSYYEDEKYTKAIEFLGKARKTRIRDDLTEYLAKSHIGLGKKYLKEQNYADAEKQIRVVLDNPELCSQSSAVAESKHLLGRVYHNLALIKAQNPQNQFQLLRKAIDLELEAYNDYSTENPNFKALKSDLANACHDLIGLYINAGMVDPAKVLLSEALKEADDKGLPKDALLDLKKQLDMMK